MELVEASLGLEAPCEAAAEAGEAVGVAVVLESDVVFVLEIVDELLFGVYFLGPVHVLPLSEGVDHGCALDVQGGEFGGESESMDGDGLKGASLGEDDIDVRDAVDMGGSAGDVSLEGAWEGWEEEALGGEVLALHGHGDAVLGNHVVLESEALVAVVEDDARIDLGELVGLEVEEEVFAGCPGVSGL